MHETERKSMLLQACQTLDECGVFDEFGHFSARAEPGGDTAYVNGVSPGVAGLRDFVPVPIEADDRPDGTPSELPIHRGIYRARDDVNAVCHNHSPYAVTVATLGLEMRPVHGTGAIQSTPIDVYDDYDPEGGLLITTEREGAAVAEALGDDRGLMLDQHGAVVAGASIPEVVLACLRLERNARWIWQQAAVGDVRYVPEDALLDDPVGNALERAMDYYLPR